MFRLGVAEGKNSSEKHSHTHTVNGKHRKSTFHVSTRNEFHKARQTRVRVYPGPIKMVGTLVPTHTTHTLSVQSDTSGAHAFTNSSPHTIQMKWIFCRFAIRPS